MNRRDVIIVGGGASGLFCSAILRDAGMRPLIIDPNRFLGRKLRITGKGRCNVTNHCSADEVMKNIPRNPKFLYSALAKFPPEKIIQWFEDRGVPLKTERGRRVFPSSDCAADVADALDKGAEAVRAKVTDIIAEDGRIVGVKTSTGEYYSDVVVLATGGLSYPATGSTGDGYRFAEMMGHTVVMPQPSLVPIETDIQFPMANGLTLKNVSLSLYDLSRPKKATYHEQGELMLTDFGITGPLALTASCLMDADIIARKGYKLAIDFKPALTIEQLDDRLLRDISSGVMSTFGDLLAGLMPRSICEVFEKILRINPDQQLSQLDKHVRTALVMLLKSFELTPLKLRSFDEAIITRGGVSVKEIDPATMESKIVKGLYFTGEIIDCDGFTGGYNLTIAFSTAYCAADDIMKKRK